MASVPRRMENSRRVHNRLSTCYFFLGFFLLPSAWLSAGATWLFQRGWRLLGWIVASANILWCVFIVTSWCFGIFSEIASLHETGPLLPYLLFAYGVTLGPWTYLASQDTEGSMLIVFFALLGLVAMMIVQEFALPVSLLLAFGVPIIGGALLQILLGLFVLQAISAERK